MSSSSNHCIFIESFHSNYIICALYDGNRIADIVYSFGEKYDDLFSVYSGIVENHVESLSAYFVNYGSNRNGFLPYSLTKSQLSIGDKVIVQIVKAQKGPKGAKVSQFIKIYNYDTHTSFSPYGSQRNILEFPTDNAAVNDDNIKFWSDILNKHANKKYQLLYRSKNQVEKFLLKHKHYIRDVYIDSNNANQISNTCMNLGFHQKQIKIHQDKLSLFSKYHLEDDLKNTLSNSVRLKSGGEIVISQAEAMVAIDVNSASCKDGDIESMILLVNLEAAEEISRQIRLRNLSGIIVIDFIDMYSSNNKNIVESMFKKHMSGDHVSHNISSINEFGVLMMSRQGGDVSVGHSIYDWCRHCGSGNKNVYHTVRDIISEIRLSIHTHQNNKNINVKCNSETCESLYNHYKRYMTYLEDTYNVNIVMNIISDHLYYVTPKGEHAYHAPQDQDGAHIADTNTSIVTDEQSDNQRIQDLFMTNANIINHSQYMFLNYGLYSNARI